MELIENKKKKQFTILGFSIWRILAYFIIYSVAGYVIETLFGIITKGVWESRQSFLYGPFCGIYGVGAVIMIVFLQYFSKNNFTLFCGGFLIGSVTEYIISLIGEVVFQIKWWDYSDMLWNIQGRICVLFSIFWGILAIYLMVYINPQIDKLIAWFQKKFTKRTQKILITVIILFLLLDCLITGVAIKLFYLRMIYENDIDVAGDKQAVEQLYEEVYGDEEKARFIDKYWGDKKMIMTFPNIKFEDANGNLIHFNTLLKDIKPYYLKIY